MFKLYKIGVKLFVISASDLITIWKDRPSRKMKSNLATFTPIFIPKIQNSKIKFILVVTLIDLLIFHAITLR